ncbi:hypothetical protein RCL1_002627 [Eukaryota sp. TZLM3-RCL]
MTLPDLHKLSRDELIDLVLHYYKKCSPTFESPSSTLNESLTPSGRFARIVSPPKGYYKKGTSPSTPSQPRSSSSTALDLHLPSFTPSTIISTLPVIISTIEKHITRLKKSILVTPSSRKNQVAVIKACMISSQKLLKSCCEIKDTVEKGNEDFVSSIFRSRMVSFPNETPSDCLLSVAEILAKPHTDLSNLQNISENINSGELSDDSVNSEDLDDYFNNLS